jgi:Domain of unknown function (DUF4345)
MKSNRIVHISSVVLILFSALSLLYVSAMAIVSPQAVMDLVQVTLPNNDAFSSIRGVYGGVGLTIVISLIYLAFKDAGKGLVFLAMLWGFYAVSRLLTVVTEGALGDFGKQWLTIESTLCLLAVMLLALRRKYAKALA